MPARKAVCESIWYETGVQPPRRAESIIACQDKAPSQNPDSHAIGTPKRVRNKDGQRAMDEDDIRRERRDSLFLQAQLRLGSVELPVKVRNLSSGGAMIEGALRATKGAAVSLNLRNIGWIEGDVAWVEGNRCGVAFRDQIDPVAARFQISGKETTPVQRLRPTTDLKRL